MLRVLLESGDEVESRQTRNHEPCTSQPTTRPRLLHALLLAPFLTCPSSAQNPSEPRSGSPEGLIYGLDADYVNQRVAAYTVEEPLPTPILAWFALTDRYRHESDLGDDFHDDDRELLAVVVAIEWMTSARMASAPIHQQLCDVADDDVVRRGRLLSDAIRTEYAAFAGLIGALLEQLTSDGAKRVDALVSEDYGAAAPMNSLVDWESLAMDTPAIVERRTAGLCQKLPRVPTNSVKRMNQPTQGKTQ